MLDQNTDRMWYVIGAVIVGAAIIFLANGALPNLFASGTHGMSEVLDDVTYAIDSEFGGRRKLDFSMRDSVEPMASAASSHEWLSDTSIRFNSGASYYAGLRIPEQYFEIGNRYTISFDMQKVSGDIRGIGGHLLIADSVDVDVRIDGVRPQRWDRGLMGPAGTTSGTTQNEWMNTVEYPNDLEEHHIELTFDMVARDIPDGNGVVDNRFYIQPNRAPSGYALNAYDYDVIISNIEYYVHE